MERRAALLLDFFYIAVAVLLANTLPAFSYRATGYPGFIVDLALGSLGALVYAYTRAVYVAAHVLLATRSAREALDAVAVAATRLKSYLAALLALLAVSLTVSFAAVAAPSQWYVMAGIGAVAALVVDAIVLPYLLLARIGGYREGLAKLIARSVLTLYLPWQAIVLGVAVPVNMAIAGLAGPEAILPYYRWTGDLLAAYRSGEASTWIPSYGEIIAALVVARYTAWIIGNKTLRRNV